MRYLGLIALAVAAAPLAAQDTTYTPTTELPHGRQVLAVYIGASDCGPCQDPGVKAAVRHAKSLLATQAKAQGADFAAVGVALDWSVDKGMEFLRPLGAFDEAVVGSNWVNSAALRYVWADTTAAPAIPQIVILERTVIPNTERITFGHERVIERLVGGARIMSWANRGAPLLSDTGH